MAFWRELIQNSGQHERPVLDGSANATGGEELTVAQIDRVTANRSTDSTQRASWRSHNGFCRARQTYGAASLDQKQRLQQPFSLEMSRFGWNPFSQTAPTAPLFKYRRLATVVMKVVTLTSPFEKSGSPKCFGLSRSI